MALTENDILCQILLYPERILVYKEKKIYIVEWTCILLLEVSSEEENLSPDKIESKRQKNIYIHHMLDTLVSNFIVESIKFATHLTLER